MAPKEISVKNLANVIQARMSEILDFVTYHLKQVGMDNRVLNGGIILTGGGSQLNHLIQLTEYVTGLNARIGYPNEHLSGDHNEELAKPMYSTCIGLILKGYNDYENKRQLGGNMMHLPGDPSESINTERKIEEEVVMMAEAPPKKKTRKSFLDSIKNNLIEMFKEEEDTRL